MELQLKLLPYTNYNTLGFDPVLIDYIDHIDDIFLLDIIDPLYGRRGRTPVFIHYLFCILYLYFT